MPSSRRLGVVIGIASEKALLKRPIIASIDSIRILHYELRNRKTDIEVPKGSSTRQYNLPRIWAEFLAV